MSAVIAYSGCDAARLGAEIALAIEEAKKPTSVTKHYQYICEFCKGVLLLKRTRHERYNVKAFFAHKPDSKAGGCNGGGVETQEHLRCKYYLKKYIGHYDFCVERCPNFDRCQDSTGFITKSTDLVEVEKSARIDGKLYKYDLLISRGKKPRVAVEILHTHSSTTTKVEDTRRKGVALVEIKTSDILERVELLCQAQTTNTTVTLPNQTEVSQTCAECLELQRLRVTQKLLQYKVLQQKAYRQAEAVKRARGLDPRNFRSHYDRYSFKCCGCKLWHKLYMLCHVSKSKFSNEQFRELHLWHIKNNRVLPEKARYCDECVLKCPGCNDLYTLQHALKYGLCRDCNIEMKEARRGECVA